VAPALESAVRASLSEGVGILKTARTVGCGVGTVQRIKAELALSESYNIPHSTISTL
jgi:hypothetical protein